MFDSLTVELIVGQRLVDIAHSPRSSPEFVVDGIGPAAFRSNFLIFASGLVVSLDVVQIDSVWLPSTTTPGETEGIPLQEVVGRSVVAVVRDNGHKPLVILTGGVFLEDFGPEHFLSNTLVANRIVEAYSKDEIDEFIDYWTEAPLSQTQISEIIGP